MPGSRDALTLEEYLGLDEEARMALRLGVASALATGTAARARRLIGLRAKPGSVRDPATGRFRSDARGPLASAGGKGVA